ncbi:pentatricopeptide repeat-containing protein At1g06270-like isoform X1 [Impatiens glandulifera]|uniref:pentatricopeptide repeat-containing protein At1g06270-like isoform X1 n=1 Tax=Impatiens glandulifera TaxID=253017 RepID=UPI001FB0E5FB|nr:pentatricopeptide repeat-containing protein At1g06270-like isoform X1 [Impatiens glandulifera]
MAFPKIATSIGCSKRLFSPFYFIRSVSSLPTLQESIKTAVESKSYQQIPDLLIESGEFCNKENPFSFLSTFPEKNRIQAIDELLQSFVPIRPRSSLRVAYSYLLSYSLQTPNPLPLALAIIQRTSRSGCIPNPQINLLLSTAWIDRRAKSQSVTNLLNEMRSIGYYPDCGTCNYLISSLCSIDQLEEAVKVLNGMSKARCTPDLDSYGSIISKMCALRKSREAFRMMKEMVEKFGLNPRQETVLKVVASMRINNEMWGAVEMIKLLENAGCLLGFEIHDLAVKGCLERRQYVLAGKSALRMSRRGFIPYITTRQKVVERLASIGEVELASAVRQSFVVLKS